MMENYTTSNMIEAASLWCQEEIRVDFAGILPTDHPKVFKFSLEVETTKVDLDRWLLDYTNGRVRVEPTALKAKWDKLKDRVSKQTGGRR